MRDEPDIEDVLAKRRPAHDAPSLYVSPSISDVFEDDLRQWNLIPVRMSAEDFIYEWSDLLNLRVDSTPEPQIEIGLRIGRQFIELQTNAAKPPKLGVSHDFLGGDEPDWFDINESLNANFEWMERGVADLNRWSKQATGSGSTAYLVVGRRLTGRSTGLLVLARSLRSSGWRTLFYGGEDRPDVDALIAFAATISPARLALVFDGVVHILDDIDRLITKARSARLDIVCLGVDESDSSANILTRMKPANLFEQRLGEVRHVLSKADGRRLVDKLASAGRLGFLGAENDRTRVAHFSGREIFWAMEQLENAPSFGRRVGQLVDELTLDADIRIVLLASYASRIDEPLLVADAARMLGVKSDDLARSIRTSQSLRNFTYLYGQQIKTRQRWLALEPAIAKLGKKASLTFVGDAISRVQTRLNWNSLRARNSTSMLVAAMMTHKNLDRAFPETDWDPWYEKLRPVFGDWSARYWEQRAIYARRVMADRIDEGLMSRAESFAYRAVGLLRDTYSLTTLGTILLAKAAHSPGVDVGDYFRRAQGVFAEAVSTSTNNLVAWDAFLRHSLPVVRKVSGSTQIVEVEGVQVVLRDYIRDEWLRVYSELGLISGRSEETRRQMRGLKRQFDGLLSWTQ